MANCSSVSIFLSSTWLNQQVKQSNVQSYRRRTSLINVISSSTVFKAWMCFNIRSSKRMTSPCPGLSKLEIAHSQATQSHTIAPQHKLPIRSSSFPTRWPWLDLLGSQLSMGTASSIKLACKPPSSLAEA